MVELPAEGRMARLKGCQAFTALPNWIFEKQKLQPGWLSCQELSVLMVLQHFAGGVGRGDEVFPSQKTISSCAGISKSTVIRCILALVEKNLIEKTPRYDDFGQKTNLYRLMIWDGLPSDGKGPTEPAPMSQRQPPVSEGQAPPVRETRAPCHSDKRTRTIEQEPINKIETPLPPRQPKQPPARMDLPDWLEPCRKHLMQWLCSRQKRYKLKPELTSSTMRALEYARDAGVLEVYCEYVSERNWQSLGFAGHRDTIEKLAKENGIATKTSGQGKPAMSPIVYTLN